MKEQTLNRKFDLYISLLMNTFAAFTAAVFTNFSLLSCNKLHDAVKTGKVKSVEILLDEMDVNYADQLGTTALHVALECEDEEMGEFLLQRGADPNAGKFGAVDIRYGKDRITPLHIAAWNGLEDILSTLLLRGANVNACDMGRNTALHFAAQARNGAIARRLVRTPGVIVGEKNRNDLTPLLIAVEDKAVDVVKALLHGGADSNSRYLNGDTILHKAVKAKQVEICRLLIKHGASLEANNKNYTALNLAARLAHEEMVRMFIEANAQINYRRRRSTLDSTPLHDAVNNVRNIRVVRLLLENGAKVNAGGYYKFTALHRAAAMGFDEAAAALIEAGADLNAKDKMLYTPIHFAAYNDKPNIVDLLLRNGALTEEKSNSNQTPLQTCTDRQDKVTRAKAAFSLIEGGVEIHDPERLLTLLWPLSYELLTKKIAKFKNFDECVSETTKIGMHSKDLKELTEIYCDKGAFALYRVLKKMHVKNPECSYSYLGHGKFVLMDAIFVTLTRKTYLEKVPVEVIFDVFSYTGYYVWKVERLAWNLALASSELKIDFHSRITENAFNVLLLLIEENLFRRGYPF